jgi:hypothetical protein
MDQARAKLQQHSAAPQPSTNGGGAPVTVGAAVAAPQPIANGGGALVAVSDGHDDPRWEEIREMVAEIRETPDGAALLGDFTDGGDIGPPPPTRQRTEEPPFDFLSLLASPVRADAPAAVSAGGYRGLGDTDEEPQQWQSMGASDQEPAPAFRSLGADDEPVLRSAAAAATATAAPAPPPLAPPLRAVAMTTLKAIAREMLRQRREKGAAAAAAVSSMAEELEDLRQWIRFHRG